jgi:hypothetical protein
MLKNICTVNNFKKKYFAEFRFLRSTCRFAFQRWRAVQVEEHGLRLQQDQVCSSLRKLKDNIGWILLTRFDSNLRTIFKTFLNRPQIDGPAYPKVLENLC